jgi:hypothetical protein
MNPVDSDDALAAHSDHAALDNATGLATLHKPNNRSSPSSSGLSALGRRMSTFIMSTPNSNPPLKKSDSPKVQAAASPVQAAASPVSPSYSTAIVPESADIVEQSHVDSQPTPAQNQRTTHSDIILSPVQKPLQTSRSTSARLRALPSVNRPQSLPQPWKDELATRPISFIRRKGDFGGAHSDGGNSNLQSGFTSLQPISSRSPALLNAGHTAMSSPGAAAQSGMRGEGSPWGAIKGDAVGEAVMQRNGRLLELISSRKDGGIMPRPLQ